MIHPATLVAMDIGGVDEIYTVGGAQAIAAMAYGTESIGKVDLIAGPGNRYVTEAKRQVMGTVGIDSLAGPSEVLIVADETANPEYIAMSVTSSERVIDSAANLGAEYFLLKPQENAAILDTIRSLTELPAADELRNIIQSPP